MIATSLGDGSASRGSVINHGSMSAFYILSQTFTPSESFPEFPLPNYKNGYLTKTTISPTSDNGPQRLALSSLTYPGLPKKFSASTTSDPGATISSTLSQENYSSQSRKKVPHVQEFAFVNATTPFKNRDPEVRKLVRGHAVKDSSRKRKLRRENETPTSKALIVNSESIIEVEEDELSLKSRQISSETEQVTLATLPKEYFSSFPRKELDPHPGLSLIIHHITEMGYAMYPDLVSFKMSPISPTAWFDSALRDEALFHALLFTTTSYAGLIGGSTETKESIVHFGKSVGLVKERLEWMCDVRSGRKVTVLVEGTARAVSCLAFTEVMRGNAEGWKTHMMGLKQMVEVRGGITEFSIGLQLKIQRADLLGATEHLCQPYFSESNGLPPLFTPDTNQSRAQIRLVRFLDTLPISPGLLNSLIYMYALSERISSWSASSTSYAEAEQISLMKDTFSLRYSLFSAAAAPPINPDGAIIDDVLRIGALLYLQATPRELPFAVVGPGNLVKELRKFVSNVHVWNEREAELVLWLLFMGAICGRKGPDRIWYIVQIEKLTERLRLREWDVVKKKLEAFWWVSGLHEKAAKKAWEDSEVLRNVMSGE